MSAIISNYFDRFCKDYVQHNTRRYITVQLEITQRLLDEDRFHNLEIFADRVILKEDLQFTGKHLRIQARHIELVNNVKISTSVTDDELKRLDWGSPHATPNSDYFEAAFRHFKKDADVLAAEIKAAFSIGNKNDEISNFVQFINPKATATEWLNELLTWPGLIKNAASRNRYKNIIEDNYELTLLTAGYDAVKNYYDHDAAGRQSIRRANRTLLNLAHQQSPPCIFVWHDYEPGDAAPAGPHADVKNIHFANPDFTEALIKDARKDTAALVREVKEKCGHLKCFQPYLQGPKNSELRELTAWLNSLLTCSRLADEWLGNKPLPAQNNADRAITTLMQQTNRVAPYSALTADQQLQIRRLNRCMLQLASPNMPDNLAPAEQKEQGLPGGRGANGMSGSEGMDAGNIYIAAERITLNNYSLHIHACGSRGGRGQDGGRGGSGSDGNVLRMKDIEENDNRIPGYCWNNKNPVEQQVYDYLATILHAGGAGGPGGYAGAPGNGGCGGEISVMVINGLNDIKHNIKITAAGGAAGAPAHAGAGGTGGKKGDAEVMLKRWHDPAFAGYGSSGHYDYFNFTITDAHKTHLKERAAPGMPGQQPETAHAGAAGLITVAAAAYSDFCDQLPAFGLTERCRVFDDMLRGKNQPEQWKQVLPRLVMKRHEAGLKAVDVKKTEIQNSITSLQSSIQRMEGVNRSLEQQMQYYSGAAGEQLRQLYNTNKNNISASQGKISSLRNEYAGMAAEIYHNPELAYLCQGIRQSTGKEASLLVATGGPAGMAATPLLKLPGLYLAPGWQPLKSMPAELLLMTWHYLKRCSLNGQTEKVAELTGWLLQISPADDEAAALEAAIDETERLIEVIATTPGDGKKLWLAGAGGAALMELPAGVYALLNRLAAELRRHLENEFHKNYELKMAVNTLAQVVQSNAGTGLDFYGHVRNYVPLQGVDAWKKRVQELMAVAAGAEEEYHKWKTIAAAAKAGEADFKRALHASNDKLASLQDDSQVLKDRKAGLEAALDNAQDELQQQIVNIQNITFDFKDAVQKNAVISGLVTLINMALQTVLIATGNTAAATGFKKLSKGIQWANAHLPIQDGSTIATLLNNAGKAAARNEKNLGALNDFLKTQKEKEKAAEKKKAEKDKKAEDAKKEIPKARTITKEVKFFYEAREFKYRGELAVTQKRMAVVMTQTESAGEKDAAGPYRGKALANLNLKAIESGKPAEKKKDEKEEGTWEKIKTKGESLVLHVTPLVMDAVELYHIYKDYKAAGETFTFDNVKFAIDEASFPDVIDQFANYTSAEDRVRFKSALKRFQQTAEKRTVLQLEYTALHNKGRELAARNNLLKQEMGYYLEQTAQHEDPMITAMARFWELSYDYLRDKLLDCIYHEFQAYRFFALSSSTFADVSLTKFLGEDEGGVAAKADELYCSQNINLLRLLQENVAGMLFQAKTRQYPSLTSLEGDMCRVMFSRAQHGPLFTNKTGNFTIEAASAAFAKMAFLRVSEVKVFLQGPAAGAQVTLSIEHSGQVSIKDRENQVHEFVHEAPNGVSYGYKVIDKAGKAALNAEEKKKIVFTKDNLIYIENIKNSFNGGAGYIGLSPCTLWTVSIESDIDEHKIDEVIFEFKAEGYPIKK